MWPRVAPERSDRSLALWRQAEARALFARVRETQQVPLDAMRELQIVRAQVEEQVSQARPVPERAEEDEGRELHRMKRERLEDVGGRTRDASPPRGGVLS